MRTASNNNRWSYFSSAVLLGVVALVGAACEQEYSITPNPVDVDPGDVTSCDFTPVSGTRMRSYDCNPVFVGAAENWGTGALGSVSFHATEVVGHPFYQMWYAAYPGANGSNYGLGYAVSPNGEDWETNVQNPILSEDGGWDKDGFDAVQVVWNPVERLYAMTYQGYNLDQPQNPDFGIGAMTSPNGVDWTPLKGGAPIIDLTNDQNGVSICWPLGLSYLQGLGYAGFLAGSPQGDTCQIFRFTGASLETPTFENRALLSQGTPYDAKGVTSAAVVELNGVQYMFFVGFKRWVQDPNANVQYATDTTLSLATSTDGGATWVKDANNPFPINRARTGGNSENVIRSVAAQVIGPRIHLWVTDWYAEQADYAVGYFLYEPDIEQHP